MFIKNLQLIIPKEIESFPKLKGEGEPYHFLKWDNDQTTKEPILRYWFWNKTKTFKNRKTIYLKEFEKLLNNSIENSVITRKSFIDTCPRTSQPGPCGFAVIIAILTHLCVVIKEKPGMYSIKGKSRLLDILN
jgi:hypothetical protein